MRGKRKRIRTRRTAKARRPSQPIPLDLGALQGKLADPKPKRWALSALALVSLLLFGLFALRGDTNALYVLLLSSGSLGLLIRSLPNAYLGLTAVFLYTQPLLIYLGNTEYGYTKAIYSLAFISLLMVLWTGRWAIRGHAEVQLTPLIWPGLLFLLVALLSLINSQSFLADFQYVVLFVYFALFFLLITNTLKERRDVEFLLSTLLMAAFVASVYGLLQYYGVLPGAPGAKWTGAIISTFGNKNYLAGFLAYLFTPGLALLLLLKGRFWERALILGVLSVIYITLVAAHSDSAWLAVLLSLGVLLIGLWRVNHLKVLWLSWRWLLGLSGVAVALTAGLLASSPWPLPRALRIFSVLGWAALGVVAALPGIAWLLQRLRALPKRAKGWVAAAALLAVLVAGLTPWGHAVAEDLWQLFLQNAGRVRAWDWWVAYEMWQDHPLIGTGLGDYKREFVPYKAEFLQTERGQWYRENVGYIRRAAQAHNEYVQLTAELGLLGLLAIVIFLSVLFWSAWQRIRAPSLSSETKIMLIGLFGGIVAFLSDSLFSFPLHLPANALAFAFLLGAFYSRALGGPHALISLGRTSTRIIALVTLLIAVTVSTFAYRDWMADRYLDSARIYLHSLGDVRTAKYLLERSVKLDFAPGEAYYHLAMIALQEGNLKQAKELLEKSSSVFVTEQTYYFLAQVSFQLDEIEDARRYVDLLLAADPSPDLKPNALYVKALVAYKQGRPDEAIALLKDVLKAKPKEAKVHLNLGEIYVEQGEFQTAKDHLLKAYQLLEEQLNGLQKQLTSPETPPGTRELLRSQQKELERLKARTEELLSGLP